MCVLLSFANSCSRICGHNTAVFFTTFERYTQRG